MKLGDFVAGVFVGAVTGAVVGILTAPAEGSVTRTRLARKARKLGCEAKDSVEERLHDLKEDLEEFIGHFHHKVDGVEKDLRDRARAAAAEAEPKAE